MLDPIPPCNHSQIPLCVDLDGTLIHADLFYRSLTLLWKVSPASLLWIPIWLMRGKANVKEQVARRINLDAAQLPFYWEFVKFVRQEAGRGRRVLLFTGANQALAQRVADHLGCFERVFGSDETTNLTGLIKAACIVKHLGNTIFCYAGDSNADLEIWKICSEALLVNASPALEARARRLSCKITLFDSDSGRTKPDFI